MSQESDVCCTTLMYGIQNQCILDEIDFFYFKTCVIIHNNVSMFDIFSVKKPDSRYNSTKKSGQLYPIFKFCQPKQDNISLS